MDSLRPGRHLRFECGSVKVIAARSLILVSDLGLTLKSALFLCTLIYCVQVYPLFLDLMFLIMLSVHCIIFSCCI